MLNKHVCVLLMSWRWLVLKGTVQLQICDLWYFRQLNPFEPLSSDSVSKGKTFLHYDFAELFKLSTVYTYIVYILIVKHSIPV